MPFPSRIAPDPDPRRNGFIVALSGVVRPPVPRNAGAHMIPARPRRCGPHPPGAGWNPRICDVYVPPGRPNLPSGVVYDRPEHGRLSGVPSPMSPSHAGPQPKKPVAADQTTRPIGPKELESRRETRTSPPSTGQLTAPPQKGTRPGPSQTYGRHRSGLHGATINRVPKHQAPAPRPSGATSGTPGPLNLLARGAAPTAHPHHHGPTWRLFHNIQAPSSTIHIPWLLNGRSGHRHDLPHGLLVQTRRRRPSPTPTTKRDPTTSPGRDPVHDQPNRRSQACR